MINIDVKRIVVNNGKEIGVEVANGKTVELKRGVVVNTQPKNLFLRRVGEEKLDSSFVSKNKETQST